MDQQITEIKNKIDAQEVKLDAIYKSVEKTRKYFLLIFWITVIAFVLPLIGLVFAVPTFLETYGNLNSLGGF
jgi:t-SNARE complex subunit (syntaxin)